jgi:dTDP-4-amino-4,6-dideoxygalactose transaminase
MNEIMEIARDHNIIVIEDTAQAPGATYHDRYAGTLADMGVFSLNYHKTIHCGEGGVVVTNNEEYAERLQLIRNHGEVVVKKKGVSDITNLIGFNYRMTEIEAAIAFEQLKKLESLLAPRIQAADYLTRNLQEIEGLTPPVTRTSVKHGFYVYAMKTDSKTTGIPRDLFVQALNAEGIPISGAYQEPLYLQPVYQKRIAYGKRGFPFSYEGYKGVVSYSPGICPVTERMYYSELMYTDICHAGITRRDLDDFIEGCQKVIDNSSDIPK